MFFHTGKCEYVLFETLRTKNAEGKTVFLKSIRMDSASTSITWMSNYAFAS